MRQPAKRAKTIGLIRGARQLASFIFDDQDQYKKIYGLKEELGLFRLNGQICGRPETIVARIAKRESTSA